MAENEPQPHDNNEPEAHEQIDDIHEMTNEQLEVSSEKEPEPDREPEEPDKQKEPPDQEPERKEPPQSQVQQVQAEPDYKKQAEDYKKQIEFFQKLYEGTPIEQSQQPQQPVQQPQQPVQQQQDIYESVTVSENDLMDLMSGSPERALPVVRNFIRAAVTIAQQEQMIRQENTQRAMKYVNLNQEEFYTRFEDLKDYKQIVKIAGDEIEEANMRMGRVKPLHLCLDDIGKRARELLTQLRGNVGGTVANNGSRTTTRNGSRQGNVGGTKVTPPPQVQLTEQQKEMADLLVED